MIGYMDWAYAAKVTIYLILALLFGWWCMAWIPSTVLTWERIIASDAAEDAPPAESEPDEHEFVG